MADHDLESLSDCSTLSGVVAGLATAGGALIYAGPVNVSHAVAVVLIATAAVVGAAPGPLVAYGAEPGPAGPGSTRR